VTTRIGIFIFDGAEELDWAGPWEVLSAWAQYHPNDDVEVFTLAPTGGMITCAKGLKVLPDHSWDDAPAIDVLIYPGGSGNRAHIGDETYRKWLRGLADGGTLMTSVCTGALVLADAGLLDGRPATTHWGYLSQLTELGTNIQPRAQDRFVDDGDVITAAGVSAGIDMALHLIARLHSRERAVEVRRYIQYDPAPPV
jgi:transcriptional regulator GlxA family with amidase domain